MRKRSSKIWKIPSNEIKDMVKKNSSLAQVLKSINFVASHGNYRTLKARLEEEKIDYSHIKMGRNSNKGRKFPGKKIPLEEVMTQKSTYDRGSLKKRLLKNGILTNRCYKCGIMPIWKGKPLILVIDHINGIRDDHRLNNLQMLCPNCNSQTSTFSGRKKHISIEEEEGDRYS